MRDDYTFEQMYLFNAAKALLMDGCNPEQVRVATNWLNANVHLMTKEDNYTDDTKHFN